VANNKSGRDAAAGGIALGTLSSLLGYHLRRAQVAVFQDFGTAVDGAEITPGQFGVLVVIATNAGLSQTQLGTALGIDRSTVVAVIDRLEARGWVVREVSPHDRRSHALRLSAEGTAALARLTERVRAHEQSIARRLTAAEKSTLIELLSRVGA
jgi:DNA-binding MarR family transcriptional regulator